MEVVIKKYSNRKLYDTEISSYVTLSDIYARTQQGVAVKVMDYSDGIATDITEETLFKAIMDQAGKPENSSLRNLIVSTIRSDKQTGEVK